MGVIRTVLGDIAPEKFGLALVHEHVIADFGLDRLAFWLQHPSKGRYERKEVFDLILPHLKEIRQLGVTGFVDCTPAPVGRDAPLLASLSEASDIHILTNTGVYVIPYLPKYVFENSVDEIADIWTDEIMKGTDGTSVRAGFIKIAASPEHLIPPGQLLPLTQKVVRAAARCSLSTDAAIVCHTTNHATYNAGGVVGLQVLKILKEEDVNPNKFIAAHCDLEENLKFHVEIAQQGGWVEYENLRQERAEKILGLIQFMVKNGFEDQLLVSQDSGWYHVGEKGGGNIRGYSYLVKGFIPFMLRNGLSQEFVSKIFITNPAKAFQTE